MDLTCSLRNLFCKTVDRCERLESWVPRGIDLTPHWGGLKEGTPGPQKVMSIQKATQVCHTLLSSVERSKNRTSSILLTSIELIAYY